MNNSCNYGNKQIIVNTERKSPRLVYYLLISLQFPRDRFKVHYIVTNSNGSILIPVINLLLLNINILLDVRINGINMLCGFILIYKIDKQYLLLII